jgi:hypothetical protein
MCVFYQIMLPKTSSTAHTELQDDDEVIFSVDYGPIRPTFFKAVVADVYVSFYAF